MSETPPHGFDALIRDYLAEAFRLDPLSATAAGVHDHDGAWPDLSESGRQVALAALDTWRGRLAELDDGALTFDQRIDRDRVLAVIAAQRFGLTESRDEAWDPLWWIYVMGDGLFGLLSREFAPAIDRLTSVASRLEGLPAIIDAARAALGSIAERPVSAFHTERALQDLDGIPNLIEEAGLLAASLDPSPPVEALRRRLDPAAATALAAIERYRDHLRTVVQPAAIGEGRLGRERYAAKLVHTLGDPEMTVEHILGSAEHLFEAVRAEMARLAAELWPILEPGIAPIEDPDALTRAVLDKIAADHADADSLLDVCRGALRRIEDFCRDRDLIGLAEEPLDIQWTPVFLRGMAQAMLFAPGPFDAGQKSIFMITPIPDSWPAEQRDSYLREMNRHQLEVLTIHEAVPGHYLQGVYGNRAPSLIRSVYGDGMYAEGWAVYVTQVMMDVGYRRGDYSLLLAHWKYYLRAVVNAIVDIRIHTAGMTEDEALDLMILGGFQELAEARAKYSRARLSSTQLSTYFVGSLAFWELEHEVRRRAAAASGDPRGAEAVPMPPIIGGYPETPGFTYRPHLEGMIGHGSLPLPLLRRAVLGG
jgi:uncharacterized protein (DUF885 family)